MSGEQSTPTNAPRFVPRWSVQVEPNGPTRSTCSCGWPHVSRDPNLALIARVDHEIAHRIGRVPHIYRP